MNATRQEKYQHQHQQFDDCCGNMSVASGSTMTTSTNNGNNNRLRRSVPLYELAIQLEAALGQEISENALCDVLGFGSDCTNDNTPVRYEHFLRLFNA